MCKFPQNKGKTRQKNVSTNMNSFKDSFRNDFYYNIFQFILYYLFIQLIKMIQASYLQTILEKLNVKKL